MSVLNKRTRAWTFTDFQLKVWNTLPPGTCYLVYQTETCPTTKKVHNQGYIYFQNARTGKSLQKLFDNPTMHIAPAIGTPQQNRTYCTKEETRTGLIVELGTIPSQGKRTDLEELATRILEGTSLDAIIADSPAAYVQYSRGLERLAFRSSAKRSKIFRGMSVNVLYGQTGCGKTRLATSQILPWLTGTKDYNPEDYYILDAQGDRTWFDGYEGEKVLVIDDFYGWIPVAKLLRILDGYSYKAEIKGGFSWAAWEIVIITSNKHPTMWYKDYDPECEKWKALGRRLNQVYKCHASNPEEIVLVSEICDSVFFKIDFKESVFVPEEDVNLLLEIKND